MAKQSFKKPKHTEESFIDRAKKSIDFNPNDYLSFSFKYFTEVQGKFEICYKHTDYFVNLLDKLRSISSFKPSEFYSNRSQSLRCHPIDWNDTTENCFDLKNEEQLVETPYQFELTANEHGRVHGFLIDSTFYVRWFDPDHKLYTKKN